MASNPQTKQHYFFQLANGEEVHRIHSSLSGNFQLVLDVLYSDQGWDPLVSKETPFPKDIYICM